MAHRESRIRPDGHPSAAMHAHGSSNARRTGSFAVPQAPFFKSGVVRRHFSGKSIMKTLGKYLSALFVAIALVATVGCASTSKQAGAGEYIDDTVITTKVKAAIFDEPTLKVAEINVETFKGVVQLSGFVSSQADIGKAVQIARGVGGVKSVKNDMRVK